MSTLGSLASTVNLKLATSLRPVRLDSRGSSYFVIGCRLHQNALSLIVVDKSKQPTSIDLTQAGITATVGQFCLPSELVFPQQVFGAISATDFQVASALENINRICKAESDLVYNSRGFMCSADVEQAVNFPLPLRRSESGLPLPEPLRSSDRSITEVPTADDISALLSQCDGPQMPLQRTMSFRVQRPKPYEAAFPNYK